MKAIIPLYQEQLGEPSVTIEEDAFEVLGEQGKVVIIEVDSPLTEVGWLEGFEMLCCQRQHDPKIVKVLRVATDEDRKSCRVPLWIQCPDVPDCCGGPMCFVGQIDDDKICTEPPKDAEVWWHDRASFYVFTCPRCLGVNAVGQQF